MKPKSSPRNGASSPASQAPSPPAPGLPETGIETLMRHQLDTLNQISCALLEGSQSLRQVQIQAAHDAQLRHEACREKLHSCTKVADALEASRAAGSADLEAASRYWTDVSRVWNATMSRMAGQIVSEVQADAPLPDLFSGPRPAPFSGPFTLPYLQWNPLAGWVTANPPPLP